MEKIRGFEPVIEEKRKDGIDYYMPLCSTVRSAGYDFFATQDVVICPGEKALIWTNIKAYMPENEALFIFVRSSIAIKKNLMLANSVGLIDSDYYSNLDNDGNIGICLFNRGNTVVKINQCERIAQGVFMPFLKADSGNSDAVRVGGVGSTT